MKYTDAPTHAPRWACLLAVAMALSGCAAPPGIVVRGPGYALLAEPGREDLRRLANRVSRICQGHAQILGLRLEECPPVTIVIADEDPLTTDFTYRPESLGHYVPALERVHLDGKALAAASPETLESVLAHELAHHFVLVAFPESRRQLWLSEGLACTLETTVAEDGAACYPLLQPVLLQVAREQAIADPRQARLRRWTAGGDIPFLAPEERERSYAMAWSLVYFLLERQLPGDLPLSRRVAIICELDPESLDAMEDRWLEFLRRSDVTEQLIRLATGEGSEERHLSVWAVKQLGALRCVDEGRALRALSALSIGPDEPRSRAAALALIQIWDRSEREEDLAVDCALRVMEHRLVDPRTPPDVRVSVASALGRFPRAARRFTAPLIELLGTDDPSLRVAAAAALVRLGGKPTIANPSFWKDGPETARRLEQLSWRGWSLRHHSAGDRLP